jgi:hypothetical protein
MVDSSSNMTCKRTLSHHLAAAAINGQSKMGHDEPKMNGRGMEKGALSGEAHPPLFFCPVGGVDKRYRELSVAFIYFV